MKHLISWCCLNFRGTTMEGAGYLEDGEFPVFMRSFEPNKLNVTDFHAFMDEAPQLAGLS